VKSDYSNLDDRRTLIQQVGSFLLFFNFLYVRAEIDEKFEKRNFLLAEYVSACYPNLNIRSSPAPRAASVPVLPRAAREALLVASTCCILGVA
jgi:hypothetical protein